MYALERQRNPKPRTPFLSVDEEYEPLTLPGQKGPSVFRSSSPMQAAKKAVRRYAKAYYGKDYLNKQVEIILLNKHTNKIHRYVGRVRRATAADKLSPYASQSGINTVVDVKKLN